MPITKHANGEPLFLSQLQRFYLLSGLQTATVVLFTTSKASSNLLKDETTNEFLRVIMSSIRTIDLGVHYIR